MSSLVNQLDNLFFKVPLNKVPSQEINDLIERINSCYAKLKLSVEECIGTHEVLKEELENEEYGASARKHLLQQVRIWKFFGFLQVFEVLANSAL